MIGERQLGRNLREAYVKVVRQRGREQGEVEFKKYTSQLFKKLGHERFSIKALAEGIATEDWYNRFQVGTVMLNRGITESQAAVDVSSFSNITGQILIDRVRQNYDAPQFIGDSLFEIAPVVTGNLGLHKEPWLSRVKDDPGLLQPQQEYPETEFVEQYIELPPTEKRGGKCSVSMEAIFADKTKQMLQQADDVGFRLRFNREERQLKIVAGVTNNFRYMGTNYTTYQLVSDPAGTAGLWINKVASNIITNYQGVASIELLFSNMVDFVTGKAVMVDPAGMMMLAVPSKVPELKIALHGAMTRGGPFATSGATNTQVEFEGVPLINDVDYPLVKSQILYHLLIDAAAKGGQGVSAANAKEYVFMGNFKKAFVYREVTPFSTVQAPPGNPAEFNQDIVVQVKAMEWGVAGVQDPRQIAWSYNA